MSCTISSFKMFSSVYQCMGYTLNVNRSIFLCRRFNTLKKLSRPVSLAKLSHQSVKEGTIHFEQNVLSHALKKHHFVAPLACNIFSGISNKPVTSLKNGNPEKKLSAFQKIKKMYKEYWYVTLPVHLITSCIWYGSFYYVAVSGVDIPMLLENLGAPSSWSESLRNARAGNMILAYTLYKIASPLRYTVTIGGTTISINYLKKWGWIKPVPNTEKIKKFYEEGKEVFKAGYKDKMQVTKNEFLKTKKEVKKQLEGADEKFHKVIKETRDGLKEGVTAGVDDWNFYFRGIGKAFRRGFSKRND